MSKVCRSSIFAFGMVVGLHTIADKLLVQSILRRCLQMAYPM